MHTKDTVRSGLLPLRALGMAQGATHLVIGGVIIATDFQDPDDVLGVWFASMPFLMLTAASLAWLVARADRRLYGIRSRGWAVVGAGGFTAVSAFLPLLLWAAALVVVGVIFGPGRLIERSLLPGIPGAFVVATGAASMWLASRMQSGPPTRDRVGLTDVVPTAFILSCWIACLTSAPAIALVAALCELTAAASIPILLAALGALVGAAAWGVSRIPTDRPDHLALRLELGGATIVGGLAPLFVGCLMPLWGTNADAHWALIGLLGVALPCATAAWSTGRALRADVWLPETPAAAA